VSRTANDEETDADADWGRARNELFRMIMQGRSFSGRERNCLFLNTGSERFATASAVSGFDFADDGRCLAVTDWDRDGDLDLWVANRSGPRLRLLRNDVGAAGNYLSIGLVGNGRDTNRDAIGARVEVIISESSAVDTISDSSGHRLVQTLRAGEGFLSQSSKWLHFGLDEASSVEKVIVRWPNGETQTVSGFEVNRRYRVVQGQAQAESVDVVPPPELHASQPELPTPTQTARIALTTRVPMPQLTYQTDDGATQTIDFTDGRPTLVTLWASWCRPCLEELAALTQQHAALQDAGLRMVALNIDAIGDQQPAARGPAALLNQLGYLRAWGVNSWGRVGEAEMNMLQGLHDEFFFMKRPLPLPSSMLVDRQGRLSVIYRGAMDPQQLLHDTKLDPQTPHDARIQAACFPGRTIDHPRVNEVAQRDELQTRYRVAAFLESDGRFDDARRSFAQLADVHPEWALPHRHLAKLYLQQNELAQAETHLRQAMALDPEPNASLENTAGLLLSRAGQTAEAEARLRRAVELNPQFAEAYNNLGSIQASEGRISAAQASFTKAVEIDPQFSEALTNLGSTYAAQNQVQKAMQFYERAIEANPSYADAYNNLGTMHARLGNFRTATRYFQDVLRLEPRHPDAARNLERAQTLLRSQ
jgi:tetratricopeptide (TPR) repeat protein